MSSKNVRLASRRPSDPTFLLVLRILFVVAGIQLLAAGFVLAPQIVSSTASYFARRARIQEAAESMIPVTLEHEKNKPLMQLPVKQAQKENALQPVLTAEELLPKKELSSKKVAAIGVDRSPEQESLGIISIDHTAGADGDQILKIAIKAQSHEPISVGEVKVQVYFYDQVENEIIASKSPVTSRWLNAPVDWRDGNPELLEVTYQPDNNNPDAHYLGYVVAVYYKGELQAYRADPPTITNQFPIKVYIGHDEL